MRFCVCNYINNIEKYWTKDQCGGVDAGISIPAKFMRGLSLSFLDRARAYVCAVALAGVVQGAMGAGAIGATVGGTAVGTIAGAFLAISAAHLAGAVL
jgi:hypothetical protein